MSEPVVFHNDDPGYLTWLDLHERGFVLNLRSPGSVHRPMLHTARCPHLYYPPAIYTHTMKRPKACADDRATLERWARDRGDAFDLCATCGT